MSSFYAYTAIATLFFIVVYITDFNWKKILTNPYFIIGLSGFAIRIFVSKFVSGFPTDISCFKSWAQMLHSDGLSNFYTSQAFTDYPPGYMYILSIVGFIRQIMNLEYESAAYTLLVKMPSIIADIVTAIFVYKLALKKFDKNVSLTFGLAYVLNPLVIYVSSGWGQVDAVHTLALLVALYYLQEKKLLVSMLVYTVALLIKPQSAMFAPIYLFVFWEYIFQNKRMQMDKLMTVLKYILFCIVGALIFARPFAHGFNYMPIMKQYYETLASYPYVSVNAYNFYVVLGLNWKDITSDVALFGTISLILIVVASFYVLFKTRKAPNYFFVAAIINLLTYMFSVKMHDRYIFPVLAFMLVSIIYNKDKRIVFLYIAFTITALINCVDVIHMILNGNNLSLTATSAKVTSIANMFLTFYTVYVTICLCDNKLEEKELFVRTTAPVPFALQKSEAPLKLVKLDYIFMVAITLIYAAVAFTQLGDRFAPQTETVLSQNNGDVVVVDFSSEQTISRTQYFFGRKEDKKFALSFSNDATNWSDPMEIPPGGVFSWCETAINQAARYVKITPLSDELYLREIAFRDSNQNIIPATVISPTGAELVDEANLVPLQRNYMNGTYFDEIYHARTAYEFIHKLPVYEWTHPPLGKSIISIGIMLFGMNPFGFRVMGTLFGVLMVPVMYLFGKRVLKNSFYALFVATVFSFDFMHFTQTRIATIDSYVTFFIILMFYFMYQYYTMSYYDTEFKKTLKPLLLSGISFGLAAASKWQGIYAATGLAVLFFMSMYRRWKEYEYERSIKNVKTTSVYSNYAFKTILWCVLFFIVIPMGIYGLSYFQYLQCEGSQGLQTIINNQSGMLNYHAGISQTHPYMSSWWSWPLSIRPILYSLESVSDGVKSTIASFNNPAISWAGVVAIFFCIAKYSRKFDRTAIFLLVGYGAQYLTWIPIGRTTYIYHYFPTLPFTVLMIAYMFKDRFDKKYTVPIAYMALVVLLFIAFYGVISGVPVSVEYVNKYLKWLPGWGFL